MRITRRIFLTGGVILSVLFGGAPHAPAGSALSPPIAASDPITRIDPVAVSAFTAPAVSTAPVAAVAPVAPAESAVPPLPDSRRHFARDLEAMRLYRPGYPFWRHVFSVPNGRMAYGSAADGRLLATFPLGDNWVRDANWLESSLAELVEQQPVGRRRSERRDDTAMLLTEAFGPVVYNETRGSFIAEGAERYGSFLEEWGAIFERFGVPAEVGLAQALVESGLKGRIRSEAEAIGFCQWLPRNWARLQRSSPHVIEAYNQTTQVPYCAAHLAVLATKYGSLIPALSEHHAGGVNVGRTIINGDFAGGGDVRARYFRGAELTLLVRRLRSPGYREVAGSYGPRSFRYAEMVFGNLETIAELRSEEPQETIYAMRPARAVAFEEIASLTGLSADEIRRFNPALINRVPAEANLYLPFPVPELGPDTAFWHRPPAPGYVDVLDEFLSLDERFVADDWHDGSVFDELRAFASRFRGTDTEEGTVMASVITYVLEELSDGRQLQILTDVRRSERAHRILEQGIDQMQSLLPSVDDSGAGWAQRNALLTTANFSLR